MQSNEVQEKAKLVEAGSVVVSESGCWIWVGYARQNDYGAMSYRGKHEYVHRLAYMAHKGPIPEGMFVCHRCDVPSCTNPDHLFLGTPKQNTADMHAKGRQKYRPFGRDNPQSWSKYPQEKIEAVRLDRARGLTYGQLVVKHGVSKSHVARIVQGAAR